MRRKSISPKIRFEIFKRDYFICQYCGDRGADCPLEIDHIIPVSHGGTDHPHNLLTACRDCNAGKGASEAERPPVIFVPIDHLYEISLEELRTVIGEITYAPDFAEWIISRYRGQLH